MLVISSHDVDSAGMFPTLSRNFQYDNPAVVLDDEFQRARIPAPINIESDDSGEYDEIDTHHAHINYPTKTQGGGLPSTTSSSNLLNNPVDQKIFSPSKHSLLQNPDFDVEFGYENVSKKPDFDSKECHGTGIDICSELKYNQPELYDSSVGYENVKDHDHMVSSLEGKTVLEHETGSDSSSGFGDGRLEEEGSSGSGTPSGTTCRGTGSGLDSGATSGVDSGTPKSIRSSLTEDESGLSLPSPTDAHPHPQHEGNPTLTQTTVTSDKHHPSPCSHTPTKPSQEMLATQCGLAPTDTSHFFTGEGGFPPTNSADITPHEADLPLRTAAHDKPAESGLVPTSTHASQSQPKPLVGAGINPAFVIGQNYADSDSDSDDDDYRETAKPRFDQFEDEPSTKDYSDIKTPSDIAGSPVQDISGQWCLADSQDSLPQCETSQNIASHNDGQPQGTMCVPCENAVPPCRNAQSCTNCSPSRGEGLVASVCVGDIHPVLQSDDIPLGRIPCYTPTQSPHPTKTPHHHVHMESSTSTTI